MIKVTIIIALFSFTFAFPYYIFSQDDFFPTEESYKQETIDRESGSLRSCLSRNFKKISGNRYVITKSGEGKYSRFEDVTWNIESQTEFKENLLLPLNTILIIKDKNENNILSSKNTYDYDKGIIRITQRNPDNEIIEESAFPLKNQTTDYATLIYFLKPFIEEMVTGKTIYFNFVSSEPGLYKLKAQFVKEENLTIGARKIEAIKIRITPNTGILNVILDKLLPPTLLWYGKNNHHTWLKYEGLECGRYSNHIITKVKEIVPLETNN